MSFVVTDRGRKFLERKKNTKKFMNDVAKDRMLPEVILFHMDNGEEFQEVYMKLADAQSESEKRSGRTTEAFFRLAAGLDERGYIQRTDRDDDDDYVMLYDDPRDWNPPGRGSGEYLRY